jgi:nitronate monooxygenase
MFKTRVTELFGIQHPIIQGGMQWLARAELVAAVSNAGALGIITSATFPTAQEFREELRKAKSLTDKPFGVNINLFPTMRPVNLEEYIDVLIEEGVKIVETAGRSPEPYMNRLKEGGVKVMHKVTAVRFARTAERVGCDAVIIDGFECAGHPGEEDVTSLILVPLTADAVKIPVIAAGGFGDARGLIAALALGAEAVLMGTRFMATQECLAHAAVKEWLLRARETETMLIQRSLRNTARVLRNPVAEKALEMEQKGATLDELMPLITGIKEKELLETGNLEAGLLHCGQVIGLVRDIPTVKELIDRIIGEADEIRKRLATEGLFTPWRAA